MFPRTRPSTPSLRQGGFSLIELLLIMVVIGILAAIAIARYDNMRERAFRSTMVSDLKNLSNQQAIYYSQNFTYTADEGAMEFVESRAVNVEITEATLTGWAAQATHESIPGEQCGVYHGGASAANGAPASEPSLIECTF